MYNNREIGAIYEDIAVDYLMKKGYTIQERNFHDGRIGELDIVAMSPEHTLVIIECKYRASANYGDPLEAVHIGKQRKISKVTLAYLMKNGYGEDTSCRFDVIAIYEDRSIKHIENAFDYIP